MRIVIIILKYAANLFEPIIFYSYFYYKIALFWIKIIGEIFYSIAKKNINKIRQSLKS